MKQCAHPGKFGAIRAWLYRFSAVPSLAPLHRRIAAEVPIEGGALLDIGCGPGTLDRMIAQARPGVRVVGLEPSEPLLDEARRHGRLPNLEFRAGSIQEAPFSEEFDFALAVLSFHHWEDVAAGLDGAHRALKPGGRFWIYENDPEAPAAEIRRDRAPLWGWFRMPVWIRRRIVRKHGLTEEEAGGSVRALVERSPFRDVAVVRSGSTLRLELSRARNVASGDLTP